MILHSYIVLHNKYSTGGTFNRFKMYEDVGMAMAKKKYKQGVDMAVCKQGRDDGTQQNIKHMQSYPYIMDCRIFIEMTGV